MPFVSLSKAAKMFDLVGHHSSLTMLETSGPIVAIGFSMFRESQTQM